MLFSICNIFSGCKKDTLSTDEIDITAVRVYNDTGILIPMEVVAGKGNLLSVYQANSAPQFRFMLTDNSGNHIWTKDFGINASGGRGVSGVVAEDDGTFTIFSNSRRVNIDADGNVLKDDPDFLSAINSSFPTKVMINKNGNYFIYGMIGLSFPNYALAFEITHSGATVFKKIYTSNTLFTGCQQTADGGYLFLGSSYSGMINSRFFVCKTSPTGIVEWINYHTPPGPANNPNNYSFFTHDIIAITDGNYLCMVGSTNPDVDNTSRIYKVDPEGGLLDSIDIKFDAKNMFIGGNENNTYASDFPSMNGYCAVKRPDGRYAAFFNNGKLEEVIKNTSALRGSRTFRMNFNDDLSAERSQYLQNYYADYISSVCTTSDGKIAAFGYISSFGDYNKPVLLISE